MVTQSESADHGVPLGKGLRCGQWIWVSSGVRIRVTGIEWADQNLAMHFYQNKLFTAVILVQNFNLIDNTASYICL